jgi:hypothetical protein
VGEPETETERPPRSTASRGGRERHCARAGDRDHGAGVGADGAASAPHPRPPPPALLPAGRRPRCTSLPCSRHHPSS